LNSFAPKDSFNAMGALKVSFFKLYNVKFIHVQREGLVKVDEDWGEAGEERIGPAAMWCVAVRSME
jgi:hypothetical protein